MSLYCKMQHMINYARKAKMLSVVSAAGLIILAPSLAPSCAPLQQPQNGARTGGEDDPAGSSMESEAAEGSQDTSPSSSESEIGRIKSEVEGIKDALKDRPQLYEEIFAECMEGKEGTADDVRACEEVASE